MAKKDFVLQNERARLYSIVCMRVIQSKNLTL